MKLILLGTTGYHPNDRRQTACFLLPEIGVMFDAGTAIYRASDYITTPTLDIFLSHAHLDHCVGLTFLYDLLAECPQLREVTAYAEAEKLAAINKNLFAELLFPVKPPFQQKVLESESQPIVLTGGGKLTYFPLKHPGGSVGYRIDWPDRSLAYVTDTIASPTAAYVEKLRGVDLLIHECYFDDDDPERADLTGHSCLTPVAQVAAAAEVGRMVLVHINPQTRDDAELNIGAARRVFPKTEIGLDRMEIVF